MAVCGPRVASSSVSTVLSRNQEMRESAAKRRLMRKPSIFVPKTTSKRKVPQQRNSMPRRFNKIVCGPRIASSILPAVASKNLKIREPMGACCKRQIDTKFSYLDQNPLCAAAGKQDRLWASYCVRFSVNRRVQNLKAAKDKWMQKNNIQTKGAALQKHGFEM